MDSKFDRNELRKQAEFEQAIAALRDAIPEIITAMPHLAKLYMEYFKALKKAGFSNEQALYLIGQHGTSLGIKGQ